MAIQSIKRLKEKGFDVKCIIGDGDTTEARARKAFNNCIVKSLDKYHVIKNVGSSLYALKKEHKVFNVAAVQYIQKCIRYAIVGSTTKETLKRNLSAIVPHAFDDHHMCKDTTWCTSVHNPFAPRVCKSLPSGKPLKYVDLKRSLTKLLENFSFPAMTDKLLHLGSTQANENFNHMVARKASKAVHYSDSASLHYRVAAAVGQKNDGHSSINQASTTYIYIFFPTLLEKLLSFVFI